MMNKVWAIFALFILTATRANAGLPPTTSKISGDPTDVVTFKYQFPNFAGTHTGSTLSLGVLGVTGGGSGSATAAGAPWVQKSGDTMSGILNMGSNKITSVTDPTANQDAATKSYVDSQLLQLNPADAVYAASTANIVGTYTNVVSGICIGDTFTITATGALSIDGANPPLGARVLLKNQNSSSQDGVWTVTVVGALGVSPVLTRALDFDSSSDINAGQIIPVINGTQAGASWFQTATVSACNSDVQTWVQFQKASSSYASSTLTNTNFFVGNVSNVAADVAMSGDATLANTGAVTIANNAVTNAKAAQMAANTIKGNNTGSTANATDLTATQATAMLNNMVGDSGAGGTKGLVPAPAAGDTAAGKFLKADGTWTVPTSSGGAFIPVIQVKSINYTVQAADDEVIATAALTFTLPDCTGLTNNHFWLILNDASSGIVTITAGGANIFDPVAGGGTTFLLTDPGAWVHITCNKGSTLYVYQ